MCVFLSFCCKSMCVCENVGEKKNNEKERERARLCLSSLSVCLKEVVGNGFLRRHAAHVLRRRLEYGEAAC